MRRLSLISFDVAFVAAATLIAVALRGYFDTVPRSLVVLAPYTAISVGCAFAVFFVAGLDRTPWRYTSFAEHFQVILLTTLALVLALGLTFGLNRLTPVARSLPVVQGVLIVSFLIFARSAARFWYNRKIHSNGNGHICREPHETVLVAGLNTVSELFLLALKEFASQRIRVAGVLAEEPEMLGRAIQQTPVLGIVEDLRQVLQSLEVHGVLIDRIIVATPAHRLRSSALKSLFEVEKSSDIVIQFLPEQLGIEDRPQAPTGSSGHKKPTSELDQRASLQLNLDRAYPQQSSFWVGKRTIDILAMAVLMLTLAPIALLVALVVAFDVGFPLIFWQQRPGLGGRPFKLYKFRTMRPPHDKSLRRIPDDERSSAVGQMLREHRLDELPQLFNVLMGDMSLVGPRPLLPRDQSPEYSVRLSIRPGMTGWAQVNGGRIISSSDKLILDVWYVNNASYFLDLKIVMLTIKMILLGERTNSEAIARARYELDLKNESRSRGSAPTRRAPASVSAAPHDPLDMLPEPPLTIPEISPRRSDARGRPSHAGERSKRAADLSQSPIRSNWDAGKHY